MTIVHRGSGDTEPTEGPDRCFLDDPAPTAGDAASLMPILPTRDWKIPRRVGFGRAALPMGTRLGSSHPVINVGQ